MAINSMLPAGARRISLSHRWNRPPAIQSETSRKVAIEFHLWKVEVFIAHRLQACRQTRKSDQVHDRQAIAEFPPGKHVAPSRECDFKRQMHVQVVRGIEQP